MGQRGLSGALFRGTIHTLATRPFSGFKVLTLDRSQGPEERPEGNKSGEENNVQRADGYGFFCTQPGSRSLRPPFNRGRAEFSTQEDHRARFFEDYRKEAEDYDKEFMKKYDEDLNTTLIFVSFVFLSFVHANSVTGRSVLCSHLRIHPRCTIATPARHGRGDRRPPPSSHLQDRQYHFGDDTPSIPRWTGPSHAIVQVQATLYASLAASLFSAFLAMLGKQWLNR